MFIILIKDQYERELLPNVGIDSGGPAAGGVVHAADHAVLVDEIVHVSPESHPGEGDVFGDVLDGEFFAPMLPEKGADDFEGHRMDALVYHLTGVMALGRNDLVQFLLAEGLVPGKGGPAGSEPLQGGLEPVVVEGLDEIIEGVHRECIKSILR